MASAARRRKDLRRKKRREKKARNDAKPRECGGCSSCCTAMSIPEVATPTGEVCKHDRPDGCTIYADRPSRCRTFICGWLSGWGSKKDDRPDRVGWFAYVDDNFPRLNTVAGGRSRGAILVARETVYGALEDAHFQEALRDWVRRGSAVLVKGVDNKGVEWLRLYGPKFPQGVKRSRAETPPDPPISG